MFALALRFPAGRYHATPWGRNVNEADVAWPPEPWRILRALIAIWWRKGDHARWSEDDLAILINTLAEHAPIYKLPEGSVHAHTRHYMPAPVKTTLVFDAFARLPDDAEMVVAWPEVTLPELFFDLAADLALSMGYLGRAESWVDCQALAEWDVSGANCLPEGLDKAEGEPVRLIAPRTPADYAAERGRLLAAFDERERQSAITEGKREPAAKALANAQEKAFGATLPDRLVDALTLDTNDYQGFGWSRPAASRELIYFRRPLGPTPRASRRRVSAADNPERFTVARFVLAGRPRPRIRGKSAAASLKPASVRSERAKSIYFRGKSAAASLKRAISRRADRRPYYFRGKSAAASLKHLRRGAALDLHVGLPRQICCGLIEARIDDGPVRGFRHTSAANLLRPH